MKLIKVFDNVYYELMFDFVDIHITDDFLAFNFQNNKKDDKDAEIP